MRLSAINDGPLEDAVCRSAHAAELVMYVVEHIGERELPLSTEERELLWYAANEARSYAEAARSTFFSTLDKAKATAKE